MTVFTNSLKRIFRNKVQIAVMLVLPFLPLIPIVTGVSGANTEFKLGVVDRDNTKLTSALKTGLESKCKVIQVKEEEIDNKLASSGINYAIVINKGYTDGIINGKNPQIQGYANKEMDISKLIATYIDSYINPAKSIAYSVNGSRERFYKALETYNNGNMGVRRENISMNDKGKAVVVWGMVIMFMMFSSTYATSQLLTDRNNMTLYRTISAPLGIKSYMFQSILCYMLVSVLQITVLIPAAVFVMGTYAGNSVLNLYILFLTFSLVTVSLGIAISSFAKSVITGSALGVGITVVTCMLGGAWGGTKLEGVVKNIGKLTPPYWVIQAVRKLLDGGSFTDIEGYLGVLLLFSAVFFLLGTWKKADIAK